MPRIFSGPKKTIGIPPSLEWLQRAHGEVAIGSIFDKKLWAPKYDSWSFGLGVLLELEACDVLLNLNAMLVVEIPGPRIVIFAKPIFLTRLSRIKIRLISLPAC